MYQTYGFLNAPDARKTEITIKFTEVQNSLQLQSVFVQLDLSFSDIWLRIIWTSNLINVTYFGLERRSKCVIAEKIRGKFFLPIMRANGPYLFNKLPRNTKITWSQGTPCKMFKYTFRYQPCQLPYVKNTYTAQRVLFCTYLSALRL